MASQNFTNLTHALATGAVNYSSGTFKALLVTALPDETDLDTWIDRADIADEHPGTGGYTAGGFAVTVDSVTKDTANNRTAITFSAADPTYADATLAGVVGCIIYLSTGTAANDLLLHLVEYDEAKGVTGGNFVATFTTPFYINR